MVKKRCPTHAGSWYPSNPETLIKDFISYFNEVSLPFDCNVKVKALLCPHAGYTYCGRTSAHCWKSLVSSLEIVGFAIPFMGCQYYSTPFGEIPLDVEEIESLRHSLNAISLTQSQDEEEHSIEMMLPFLHALYVHFLKEKRLKLPKLIPLLIGSFTNCSGLLNLFKDPSCIFVISSDFCHWGSRFDYNYLPETSSRSKSSISLNEKIKILDSEAVEAICRHDIKSFQNHLAHTRNTICGANPILVFLQLIKESHLPLKTFALHYSQSSQIRNIKSDTSVSYAALLTILEE